jgi:hypothetical protein
MLIDGDGADSQQRQSDLARRELLRAETSQLGPPRMQESQRNSRKERWSLLSSWAFFCTDSSRLNQGYHGCSAIVFLRLEHGSQRTASKYSTLSLAFERVTASTGSYWSPICSGWFTQTVMPFLLSLFPGQGNVSSFLGRPSPEVTHGQTKRRYFHCINEDLRAANEILQKTSCQFYRGIRHEPELPRQ